MRKSADDFANEATEAIDEGRYNKGQAFAILAFGGCRGQNGGSDGVTVGPREG